jgi:hypothetical protein
MLVLVARSLTIDEGGSAQRALFRHAGTTASARKGWKVLIDVATSQVAAHHGRHRADTDCLAWGKDSEAQIKPFNKIEK